MIAFGKLHFVVFAADVALFTDHDCGVENLVSDALRKCQAETHIEFSGEIPESHDIGSIQWFCLFEHASCQFGLSEDVVHDITFQGAFRDNRDPRAPICSFAVEPFHLVRICLLVPWFGFSGDRCDCHRPKGAFRPVNLLGFFTGCCVCGINMAPFLIGRLVPGRCRLISSAEARSDSR